MHLTPSLHRVSHRLTVSASFTQTAARGGEKQQQQQRQKHPPRKLELSFPEDLFFQANTLTQELQKENSVCQCAHQGYCLSSWGKVAGKHCFPKYSALRYP